MTENKFINKVFYCNFINQVILIKIRCIKRENPNISV